MPEVISPTFGAKRFNCPHCHALAHQSWYQIFLNSLKKPPVTWDFEKVRGLLEQHRRTGEHEDHERWLECMVEEVPFVLTDKTYTNEKLHLIHISRCFSCSDFAIWRLGRLVDPVHALDVEPNPDMPPDARADFREAAEIFSASPKAAAAILRLALQRTLKHLGQPGKNINDDIGALVAAGLPVSVQQALDIVRVVGNNAVHPGQIDVGDNRDVALKLFKLLNIIVEQMITQPKQISEMFGQLPENATKAIEKRDAPKKKTGPT